ncbi:mCG4750, isoform CRA_b [Mus musculus]|nr:mCG4750, isoform CRA_b [Mus musculus]
MWTLSTRGFCTTVSAHTHPRLRPNVGFSFLEDERCDDSGKTCCSRCESSDVPAAISDSCCQDSLVGWTLIPQQPEAQVNSSIN